MAPDLPSRDRLQLAREYRDMAGSRRAGDDLEDIRDLDTDLGALHLISQAFGIRIWGLRRVVMCRYSCLVDMITVRCLEAMITRCGGELMLCLYV